MSRFVELMKYTMGDNNDRKKILSRIDSEQTYESKHIVELLQSEEIESTTLIQEEVYKTVMEGAEPAKCMREVLPIIKVNTNSLRYVMGETGTYASDVAEGAEISIDTQNYTKRDFTIKKVGVRPLITKELIEDSLFDVVALELKKAGAMIENKLNKDAMEELLNNATAGVALTTADELAVADVANSIGTMKALNFVPDTLILSALAESTLLTDSNLAYVNQSGDKGALRGGVVGSTVMGLKPYTSTIAANATGPLDWGGTDSGDSIAMILDRTHAGAIAMRRDLTVDRYNDPIRDLVGMSVTMRYDVKYLMAGAIVKITTT